MLQCTLNSLATYFTGTANQTANIKEVTLGEAPRSLSDSIYRKRI